VGLEPYRENVVQAQNKLTRIFSQEDSIRKLLETAEQTLNYWREQYDRYQEKKQLQTKRRFCERELVWAEVAGRENRVNELESEEKKEQGILKQIDSDVASENLHLQTCRNELEKFRNEQKQQFDHRLNLEREKARNESVVSIYQQLLKETSMIEASDQNPTAHNQTSKEFKLLNSESVREIIQNANQHLLKLDIDIGESQRKADSLEENTEKVNGEVVESRIKLALLQYKKENVESAVQSLHAELENSKTHLDEAIRNAEEMGPRIAVIKQVGEILDEMRITEGHLAALADVSEDIERMYESYSKLYLELSEKARLVAENREKALEEVRTRMQGWREVIRTLLDRVSLEYQKILGQAQALGEVRLANEHDIEAAGLEILVGFKGGMPVPLDAYTQSGGERTTATMSFLLALQQHVRSPFRAVDEYDIHMDPKNREIIAKMLISSVQNANAQYVVITPSQITFTKEEVNIITVQNIEGKSIIREVA
jgi:chromosome segregation protein